MAQRRQHRCERCKTPHREQGALCAECAVWASERYDKARGSKQQRGYGGKWSSLQALKLQRDPLCERHKANGKAVAATLVHHKVEIAGANDPNRLRWSNLESLCRECHERHHGRRK